MPGKVQQLEKWPEPREQSDLVSFLAFVNYLREFMDPDWTVYEQVFKALRKKEAKKNFEALWQGGQKIKIGDEVKFVTCGQAFEAIRAALRRGAVLAYPSVAAPSRHGQGALTAILDRRAVQPLAGCLPVRQ